MEMSVKSRETKDFSYFSDFWVISGCLCTTFRYSCKTFAYCLQLIDFLLSWLGHC